MELVRRLAELDNRVLGKPKPATPAMRRKAFLLQAAMSAFVVLIAGVSGNWTILYPAAGLIGLTIVAGARWYWSRG
jgi:hypothetical protein